MESVYTGVGQEFSDYSEFYRTCDVVMSRPQEHRSGGSFGINIVKVTQGPFDEIDPIFSECLFALPLTDIGDVLLDMGDGPVHGSAPVGTLTYYPAHVQARTRTLKTHDLMTMSIESSTLSRVMDEHGSDMSVFEPITSKMVESLSALQLMKRIWHCSETSGPFDNLALDGLLLQFFAHVAGAPAISPFGAEAVEDKRMRRVIDYIEAHLEQPINVAELAGVAALSAGHFSRAFKATTGEAVWAYVQRRRCERAKEWLIASTDPIAKIAFDCGFSSQAHMTRQFTARFGVTPGAMRKHY